MTQIRHLALAIGLLFIYACSNSPKEKLELGSRYEMTHPGKLHEVHISDAAIAVVTDAKLVIAWATKENGINNVYAAHLDGNELKKVRINPDGMTADSIHQSPGIAAGRDGEVYISWSSAKPKPEGVLFASDLNISRSLDGGLSFNNPLRINEDRPISHSFEGLDVGSDGTVFVSWIDSRDGWNKAGTYLARITDKGRKVEDIKTLDSNTCVCCRVDVAAGAKNSVAVLWRKEFANNVRDMVLDLGVNNSFASPVLVHADNWQMTACPHRGGNVGFGEKDNIYVSWYTEGTDGKPNVLFATSEDGNKFTSPKRLDASTTSIPDHVRMAVNKAGTAVIVWEDSTAVHRRVFLVYITDGGKTFSPVQELSKAIKAYAPDVAVSSKGDFYVIWHEEQFPVTKTVIQEIRLIKQ